MALLLPQHKEDRIEEIKELGHPVKPGHVQPPEGQRAGVTVIGVPPDEEVSAVVAALEDEVDEVGITRRHAKVVRQHEGSQEGRVHGRSPCHEPRAEGEDKVEVGRHDAHYRPRTVNEREVRRPRVLYVEPVLPERVSWWRWWRWWWWSMSKEKVFQIIVKNFKHFLSKKRVTYRRVLKGLP